MVGTVKVNRNDPCPCGSGKKYKRCCMAKDKAAQVERLAWERATQDMRRALIGYAREEIFVKDLAAALGLFWQDRYTAETVQLMSVDESLRFFDWFAHDYRLQLQDDPARNGRRLIEVYRREVDDALQEQEAATLDAWIDSPPGSAFLLRKADAEQSTVVLEDLWLKGRTVQVEDASAATHGEVGQILLARPLPERERVRLSGATVILPGEERVGLLAFLEEHWIAYQAEHEGATREAFLRDQAYLLTHYALEWADREERPAVAVDDPEAQRPGTKVVQRLVKWKHGPLKFG